MTLATIVALTFATATQAVEPRAVEITVYSTSRGERRPLATVAVDGWQEISRTWYFVTGARPCQMEASPTAPSGDTVGWRVDVAASGRQGHPTVQWRRLKSPSNIVPARNGSLALPLAVSAQTSSFILDTLSDIRVRRYTVPDCQIELHTLEAAYAPARPVEPLHLWTFVTDENGDKRPAAGVTFRHWNAGRQVWYFHGASTICNPSATQRAPEAGSYGWRVEVEPGPGGEPQIRYFHLRSQSRPDQPQGTMKISTKVRHQLPLLVDKLPRHNPPSPEQDCKARELSLEAFLGTGPTPARTDLREPLYEAELWFVHKDPAGKETSQRQAVRLRRDGQGEFYFDDMQLKVKQLTGELPITIEVFGSIALDKRNTGFFAMLNLNRRYVAGDTALGKWPKTGGTVYPLSIAADEVVSFVLPPLEDDHGMFLGHRFSLRLRLKALQQD